MTIAPTRVARQAVPRILSAGRLSFGGQDQTSGEVASFGGEAARGAAKPRALVVDDAPDVTEMLSFALRYAGYEVVPAFSGAQALDAARAGSFDVVVSDIGMPGMSGYELARRLRALWPDQPMRIVAVTGWGQEMDRQQSSDAGFDVHLVKPVELHDLQGALAGTSASTRH